jgi:hypothetical protein
MKDQRIIINDAGADKKERLEALESLEASLPKPGKTGDAGGEINNHIHTIYSFSPYTPSMAALLSREAGLEAAGSVDHDSVAAAEEMLAACGILGLGGCVGFEVRVSFKTGAGGKPGPFAARKINNPDSEGIAYMTVQGIPRQRLGAAEEFLRPLRAERQRRTRAMTEAANVILTGAGLAPIDFDRDVLGRSKAAEGGGITERHLLAAAAEIFIQKYGKGPAIIGGLQEKLGLEPSPRLGGYLSDPANPHYLFDLLGFLKSGFLPRIFIQPGEAEAVPAGEVCQFAASAGGIPAYAYLGDVGDSPTGDKRAEKFEDDFLEELFEDLSRLGYRAVTYMPPRNSEAQLQRVRRLCGDWGFMEISGVDINSSRQSFNCPEVLTPPFRHLIDTTWALIAHERLSSVDERFGLFSPENPLSALPLGERLSLYARGGRRLNLKDPEKSCSALIKDINEGRYSL